MTSITRYFTGPVPQNPLMFSRFWWTSGCATPTSFFKSWSACASPISSGASTLIAQSTFVSRSVTRYTVPMPPRPSLCPTTYLLSSTSPPCLKIDTPSDFMLSDGPTRRCWRCLPRLRARRRICHPGLAFTNIHSRLTITKIIVLARRNTGASIGPCRRPPELAKALR